VAERLAARGHTVYRPTLQGSAERHREVSPNLTLADYGAEIADLFFFEDVKDVIFVGTSIGGMVVCEVAPKVADRIRRLVFIDALVPLPGESVPQINSRTPYDQRNVVYGPAPDAARGAVFAGLPKDVEDWALARYTQQPIKPTDDPVDLKDFWSRAWQVDVLNCTRSAAPPAAHQKRTAERFNGTYTELAAGHYPMLEQPDAIAEYLLARG
jgi:pimeloyl-ACP methyl ester carboxylesterase